MKQIEPIVIWNDGQQKSASILTAKIVNDNLENSCSFFYELLQGGQGTEATPLIVGQTLADGNILMQGQDYLDWDNSNEAAYVYIAEKLNLTLIA